MDIQEKIILVLWQELYRLISWQNGVWNKDKFWFISKTNKDKFGFKHVDKELIHST